MALLLVTLAASCQCQLTAFHPFIKTASPSFVPVATWAAAPSLSASQYHAQDELGQASFGYAHPGQAASNFRDAWGNQVGSWAYFDPTGKEVRVSYVADSRGFRVLSNALPVAPQSMNVAPLVGPAPVMDTPEVQEAKRQHFAAVAEAKARHAAAAASVRHRRSPGRYYSAPKAAPTHYAAKPAYYHHQEAVPVVEAVPIPHVAVPVVHVAPAPQVVHVAPTVHHALPPPTVHHSLALPAVHAVAPEVHPVPVAVAAPVAVPSPIISKFHSQDEFGQAAFGHVTADQSASNFRDADGNQVGHYSYINPDGQQIVVYYTAGVGGFRVLSNALPQAPSAGVTVLQGPPAVVEDTAEVAEARRAHLALVAEARNRARSSSP